MPFYEDFSQLKYARKYRANAFSNFTLKRHGLALFVVNRLNYSFLVILIVHIVVVYYSNEKPFLIVAVLLTFLQNVLSGGLVYCPIDKYICDRMSALAYPREKLHPVLK